MKKYLMDVVILLLMAMLFLRGVNGQDIGEYQCYALAFLHGNATTQQNLPTCKQYFEGSPLYPTWHTLPREYPLLTLVPFSLGLLPLFALSYKTVFGLWMIAIAYSIYLILRNAVSKQAAFYYAVTIMLVGLGTVAARFDMVPTLLTLVAILLAQKKKWTLAMIVLSFAGCFKIYAFLLFPVCLIALLQEKKRKLLRPIISFSSVCLVVLIASLWVNTDQTISPLFYLKNRPFQIESSWASILWLINFFSGQAAVIYSYGSTNFISTFSQTFFPISSIFALDGILILYWLQIRHKLTLVVTCILVMLIAIITSKVFSPQYLMWVVPLIPLLKGNTKEIKVTWIFILFLTVMIYPYLYEWPRDIFSLHPIFIMLGVIAIRNILLIYFIVRFYFIQQKFSESVSI